MQTKRKSPEACKKDHVEHICEAIISPVFTPPSSFRSVLVHVHDHRLYYPNSSSSRHENGTTSEVSLGLTINPKSSPSSSLTTNEESSNIILMSSSSCSPTSIMT